MNALSQSSTKLVRAKALVFVKKFKLSNQFLWQVSALGKRLNFRDRHHPRNILESKLLQLQLQRHTYQCADLQIRRKAVVNAGARL